MITLPPIQITPPSDFKVKITSVTDQLGQTVDVRTTYLGFAFFVNGDRYDVVSDPVGGKSTNTVIDSDGVLWLIFQSYPFKYGRMSYCQHLRYDDTMYADGTADWWSEKVDTNVFFTR